MLQLQKSLSNVETSKEKAEKDKKKTEDRYALRCCEPKGCGGLLDRPAARRTEERKLHQYSNGTKRLWVPLARVTFLVGDTGRGAVGKCGNGLWGGDGCVEGRGAKRVSQERQQKRLAAVEKAVGRRFLAGTNWLEGIGN